MADDWQAQWQGVPGFNAFQYGGVNQVVNQLANPYAVAPAAAGGNQPVYTAANPHLPHPPGLPAAVIQTNGANCTFRLPNEGRFVAPGANNGPRNRAAIPGTPYIGKVLCLCFCFLCVCVFPVFKHVCVLVQLTACSRRFMETSTRIPGLRASPALSLIATKCFWSRRSTRLCAAATRLLGGMGLGITTTWFPVPLVARVFASRST